MCKQFKTSDYQDIYKYIRDVENIKRCIIHYQDYSNGLNTLDVDIQKQLHVDIKTMIFNAIRMIYKTYAFKSYIIVRDKGFLDISLTNN